MKPFTRNDTAFQGYAVPVERDTTFLDSKRAETWVRQMERLQAAIYEVIYRPCLDCGDISRAGEHECMAFPPMLGDAEGGAQ